MAQLACETEPDQIRVCSKRLLNLPEKRQTQPGSLSEVRSLPTTTTENLRQLLRRNNFELGVRTVAWLFIHAPPSKLRCVTEAAALHVVVSHFDYKLRPQRLPRQVFALAPPTLSAWP